MWITYIIYIYVCITCICICVYIYTYIYIYIYIYISKTRHLFLNKLYFGFLEIFEDLEETEIQKYNLLKNKCVVLYIYIYIYIYIYYIYNIYIQKKYIKKYQKNIYIHHIVNIVTTIFCNRIRSLLITLFLDQRYICCLIKD